MDRQRAELVRRIGMLPWARKVPTRRVPPSIPRHDAVLAEYPPAGLCWCIAALHAELRRDLRLKSFKGLCRLG